MNASRPANHTFRTIARSAAGVVRAAAAVSVVVLLAAAEGGTVTEIRLGELDPPVVAQRDVTVREVTSIHPIDPAPLPLECSGLAWLGDRLVVVSDRHGHVLFPTELDIGPGDVTIGLPVPEQIVDSERNLLLDAECATAKLDGRGATALVFCSMSNDRSGDRRPNRERAVRVRFDSAGRLLRDETRSISLDALRTAIQRHFDALGVGPYVSFNSQRGENTVRWGSIEGIAWTPDGRMLLCGLRNPLAGRDALLVALEGVDQAFDAEDASRMRIVDVFRLDLGGRGVTDIDWDPVTGGYLVSAALSNGPKTDPNQTYPLENVDSALFWWSGEKTSMPRLAALFPDTNIDAVCRIGRTALIALGSDEGDISEERHGRQSVITLMHFVSPPPEGP